MAGCARGGPNEKAWWGTREHINREHINSAREEGPTRRPGGAQENTLIENTLTAQERRAQREGLVGHKRTH